MYNLKNKILKYLSSSVFFLPMQVPGTSWISLGELYYLKAIKTTLFPGKSHSLMGDSTLRALLCLLLSYQAYQS
jgi:hypothetical protein